MEEKKMKDHIRTFFTSSLLLMFLFISATSWGQIKDLDFGDSTIPIMVSADMLTYDRDNEIYTAEGNVEITRGNALLKADRVLLSGKTKTAEAEGNVYFYDGEDKVEGDRVKINMDTQTGIIYNGMIFYADKNFYITGKEFEKLGDKTYHIKRGSLTTCDGDSPAWKILAKEADLTVGGYATVWGGSFRIKEVPVFYWPYGIFPVKRDRQSGFLIPNFGFSDRNGMRFFFSYFWAINKSMDATFLTDIMTKRGTKVGLEYRYFLKKDLKGQVNYSYIYDDITHHNRWSLHFDHDQTLPGDIRAYADINLISDDKYLDDLRYAYDNIPIKTSRYLESRVSLVREWDRIGIYLDGSWFDDLKDDHDDTTLQRLPRLTLRTMPLKVPGIPLYFDMSPSFVNYHRDRGLDGQRIDLNPRLTMPINLDYVSIVPWVEGNFTKWWLYGDSNYNHHIDRTTLTTGVEAFSYISRRYDLDSDSYAYLTHLIRPTVSFTYSPNKHQYKYPYLDSEDRIRGRSLLRLSLINRLVGSEKQEEGGSRLKQLLYFEMGLDIDFEPDHEYLNYRPSGTYFVSFYDLKFTPNKYLSLDFDGRYEHNRNKFILLSGGITLNDDRGDYLTVGYSYESDLFSSGSNDNLGAGMKIVLYDDMDIYSNVRYSIEHSEMRYVDIGIDYHRQCWGVFVNAYSSEFPDEYGFMVTFTLKGLGSLGTFRF